jgi:hypothetical protein
MSRIILACTLTGILGVPAKADETLKFHQVVHGDFVQSQEIGDIEGHILYLIKYSGPATLADGSTVTVTGWTQNDLVKGSGIMAGYASQSFSDGSVIWYKWSGIAADDGKVATQMGAGTIIGGKGRYAGAKGDVSWTGARPGAPGLQAQPYADVVINIKK